MESATSQASQARPTAYDQVLYPGISYRQSHPDRLATQATLFGMTPAPLERCRVLELGCGDGANLIPIAFGLPRSQCTGIDLAARPIASAQRKVEALGLGNVTLRQMDLREVNRALGEFDYIIAHGVYSWTPPEVQDALLSVCSQNLAPQGVAYVSYNAYPGGHIREMLRRMMLYHVRGVEDPYERVKRGLKFIEGLMQSVEETNPFRHIIQPEFERMREIKPESVFHDDLNEFNTPVYFHEFVGQAARHGLQYLSEAALAAMYVTQVSIFGRSDLAGLDVIDGEQMLDFKLFRNFRATLLCHPEISLDRTLKPERIRSLWASSAVIPDSPAPDIPSSHEETFRAAEPKLKISTNHPLTKGALWLLASRWPGRVAFEDLKRSALELCGWKPQAQAGPTLEDVLLKMYCSGMVELHVPQPALCERAGERPVASRLATLMLGEGSYATNLRHEGIEVDPTLRRLILLLDGARDCGALLREMNRQSASTEPDAANPGGPLKGPAAAPEMTPERLEENLQKISRMALLIA